MYASCANTLQISSWPPELLEESAEFTPLINSKINNFSWCNDNSYVLILQERERPQILSTKNLDNIRVVHTLSVPNASSVTFKNKTKKNLAFGTQEGDIAIYDTKARCVSKNFAKLVAPIDFLAFNNDDQQLAALCEDTAVVFYTETDGEVNNEYKHSSKCCSMKFHPSVSNRLAVGCSNGYVSLWDTKVSSRLYNCQLHAQSVTGISLSRCGNFLISVGRDRKICLTDLASGECQFRINLNVPITAVDLRHDDKIVAVGLEDGGVYLYDMNFTVQPLSCHKPHNSPVNTVAFANKTMELMGDDDNEGSCISTVTSKVQNRVSELCMTSPKTGLTNNNLDDLERLKRDVMRTLKFQSEDLELQLKEHCEKFQMFINNEFQLINDIMKEKWELFGTGDADKAFGGAGSEYGETTKM